MASYKEFSEIYDLLMTDIDYDGWTAFIVNNLGEGATDVLEAACGTGSITCRLYEHNIKVTAFDLSVDMLMRAKEKLGRSPGVRLICQDMECFNISGTFDGAICCCDGVNYLSKVGVCDFVDRIYKHLKPEGRFIFDMSTAYKYETMYNDTYVYDDGNIFYVWENEYDVDNNAVDSEINFFVCASDDRYARITEQQTQYVHTTEQMVSYLGAAGFKNIEIFDGYSSEPFKDDTLRAVFCCVK